jgi:hypothetical protein
MFTFGVNTRSADVAGFNEGFPADGLSAVVVLYEGVGVRKPRV